MELDETACAAIITENTRWDAAILGWHRLVTQARRKVRRHVCKRLFAERTSIVRSSVAAIAACVHQVPTTQKLNRIRRCKEVLAAHGAVRFETVLHTAMTLRTGRGHARIALHTMEIVNTKTFADAADITVATMIDIPIGRIVVELANETNVVRETFPTGTAYLRRRLLRQAPHTENSFHCVAVHDVVIHFIVTKSTRVVDLAAGRKQSTCPRIVSTTELARRGVRLATRPVHAADAAALWIR